MPMSQGQFTVVNTPESQVFGFDFALDLPVGDSVTTVSAITLEVFTGTDTDPDSHLIGSPSVNGTQVLQRIAGLVTNVTYRFGIIVNTTLGNVLELWNYLPCVM